jgi:GT2 family glycosyltransferase
MSNRAPIELSSLPWTGERMVPLASDLATQVYHWQRYLYFRPWYEGVRVVDAASGEGYGTSYASHFSTTATGYDISYEAVDHATKRYDAANFRQADVCDVDYSDADLVVSFETIEHLEDPSKFLEALKTCKGRIVISTPNRENHSPGNKLEDKPFNQHHTIEWTPLEFAELIRGHFQDRQIRFLSQGLGLPGQVYEGLDQSARYCIAVIGEGDLPHWPSIGYAIPTHNNWPQLLEAIHSLTNFYPGQTRFAITANACNDETLNAMRKQESETPGFFYLIEQLENRGYGIGANLALEYLQKQGDCEYYAVVNDDVIATVDCVSQMVAAMRELELAKLKPGVVVPVSNAVNGAQRVEIGEFHDYKSMVYRAEQYHRANHSKVNQSVQVRGLFMLIHPDCLREIGGFDPLFGLGNFEDDDHNLRCKFAGYTLWIASGAFLYHHGSTTFQRLNIDYAASIQTNMERFGKKWNLQQVETWPTLTSTPDGVNLFVSLSDPNLAGRYEVTIGGAKVDLINEATEIQFAEWVAARIRAEAVPRKTVVELIEGVRLSA